MAAHDPACAPLFGELLDIPFRSETPHETRVRVGHLMIFEDVVADAVVILLNPAGAAPPSRLLLSLDDSLEAAHNLIAAAARLHRSAGQMPDPIIGAGIGVGANEYRNGRATHRPA